ncbi:MAG: iron-containing redox enzyme family protein, partial [Myxococcota bacterium]
ETRLHQLLYRIHTASLALPWCHDGLNVDHPVVGEVQHIIESAWEQHDRQRYAGLLTQLPTLEAFPTWIRQRVQSHPCNVCHPLFTFLRDEATYQELRHFLMQETPMDIYFGDIINMMMAGIYGSMKVELCGNFWDEMGRGNESRMHRVMRLDMMAAIDIPPDHHLTHVAEYCLEELRLANMYFDAVRNRSKLSQALGILLATELMVPGRLEYQIAGWRRVGLSDDALAYLIEHTVVDVEHADGWMDHVITPLLHQYPAAMSDIVFGVERRLVYAGAVCDHFYSYFSK